MVVPVLSVYDPLIVEAVVEAVNTPLTAKLMTEPTVEVVDPSSVKMVPDTSTFEGLSATAKACFTIIAAPLTVALVVPVAPELAQVILAVSRQRQEVVEPLSLFSTQLEVGTDGFVNVLAAVA